MWVKEDREIKALRLVLRQGLCDSLLRLLVSRIVLVSTSFWTITPQRWWFQGQSLVLREYISAHIDFSHSANISCEWQSHWELPKRLLSQKPVELCARSFAVTCSPLCYRISVYNSSLDALRTMSTRKCHRYGDAREAKSTAVWCATPLHLLYKPANLNMVAIAWLWFSREV